MYTARVCAWASTTATPCDNLRRHLSIDYSQISAAAHHRHLAAEEADALSKKLASSVRVDAQETWQQQIFPYFTGQGEGCALCLQCHQLHVKAEGPATSQPCCTMEASY